MTLGMSLSTFTTIHVVISLIAIATGIAVVVAMLSSRDRMLWTALFLGSTVLTSITGFMFPYHQLLPSHIFGAISIVALAVALYALYARRLAGVWRWTYVSGALLALYLNMFVGVVQSFQKLPFLQPLAPTQSELPFVIAQSGLLVAFGVLGYLAVTRFYPVAADAG